MVVVHWVPVLFDYLLLLADSTRSAGSSVPRLQLEDHFEQVLRQLRQELDLGVGVKTVQDRALWWQVLVHVGVITNVVQIWGQREVGCKEEVPVQLLS